MADEKWVRLEGGINARPVAAAFARLATDQTPKMPESAQAAPATTTALPPAAPAKPRA